MTIERCACGGRIDPSTNGTGRVVDTCSRCGAAPGQGRAPQPPNIIVATDGKPCKVDGCPGTLDRSGACACCQKRTAWVVANSPKRDCAICGGSIVGARTATKYCPPCKAAVHRLSVAKAPSNQKVVTVAA